jgi:pullulanase/glycogen debranching enzyme
MGPNGPGIIINEARLPAFNKTPFDPPAIEDMVIMEAHVRDLTAHAPVEMTVEERQGFKGLTKWLKNKKSYLKEIGLNTIELQPIQQFDSVTPEEYHWGYMTNNYFAPCCHYGTKPEKASQIQELRELVDTAHKQGLAIIIDVVYNHVGEPPHLLYIDKKYYFDLAKDMSLMNWSGCGNTLRADTPMGRKLIIESLKHLVEFYGIDGFRFDLAELIGIAVLSEIETELKKVNPKIVLIAEPWSFRGNIARDLKKTGYSFWNDGYREFMVEYMHGHGNQEGIRYFLKGSLDDSSAWPGQSINYVESHDDRCWLDKVTENADYRGDHPTHNDRIRTQMMIATLMCSIGTPMISAGQDMLRSKQGINNTYQRGDINALNYGKLNDHGHTHEYFKKWIAFRQSDLGKYFRLKHRPADSYIAYYSTDSYSSIAQIVNVDFSQGEERLLFAVNPHDCEVCIYMHGVYANDWKQLAHQDHFDENGFNDGWIREEGHDSTMLHLKPLSCGLWVQTKHPDWN